MRKPVRHRRTDPSSTHPLAWLEARLNYERTPATANSQVTFGLARMRRLLHALGDPQRSSLAAHIAGTKGKGSTAAMMASILQASGRRVGRYLSPHVHDVTERIAVDGTPISRDRLATLLDSMIPVVAAMDRRAARRGGRGPTWFEVMTAAAFVHFADEKVDIAVLETGLGGRLDATNVCTPIVTVITSISYDHLKLLGPTLHRIATEKAGIIKRRCVVVSGVTQPSARRVIRVTATRRRAPLLELGTHFAVRHVTPSMSTFGLDGTTFQLVHQDEPTPHDYTTRLAGRHQVDNAALAVIATEQLALHGISIDEHVIARGLATATLPARIETICRRPLVVVDAAHNVASMSALASTLRQALEAHHTRVLVFSASSDKQIEKMLDTVRGLFDHVIITRYLKNPRSAPLERVAAACRAAGFNQLRVATDPPQALKQARSIAGRNGIVVVAGSFFLASELRGRGSS